MFRKTFVKRQLSRKQKNGFQDRLLLYAGQKYCKMLQREHSAILLTFIKLPVVIKTFVLSIFEWLFYTGFTVHSKLWACFVTSMCRRSRPKLLCCFKCFLKNATVMMMIHCQISVVSSVVCAHSRGSVLARLKFLGVVGDLFRKFGGRW